MNNKSNQVVLAAQGLSKRFDDGAVQVQVLQGVDIQVHAGETLAIIGASGSGESTLLHLLGGLDAPSAGQVVQLGRNLHSMNPRDKASGGNQHLGFVYQFHHLLPEFTAQENVAMPLLIRRMERAQAQLGQADSILSAVGLGRARRTNRPSCLAAGRTPTHGPLPAPWSRNRPACWPTSPPGNLDRGAADEVFCLDAGTGPRRGHRLCAGHPRRNPGRTLRPATAPGARAAAITAWLRTMHWIRHHCTWTRPRSPPTAWLCGPQRGRRGWCIACWWR